MSQPGTRKAGLSLRAASGLAWRDVRFSPGRFLFVLAAVAIGVAALVGVRGFSESYEKTLLGDARSLMAADLAARMFRAPNSTELAGIRRLEQSGAQATWVRELVSMASVPPDPVPILVSVKAVDPARYPFYGRLALRPDRPLAASLTDGTVLVAEELLIRLHARPGSTLRLGGRAFTIAGVLVSEPDRLSASAGLGPRVLMTNRALDATGLLAPGSRSSERLLLRLASAGDLPRVRKQLEQMLPEAQVTDFRESNPALTEGINRASGMLSLICLVAMVLGAIGVAMAMRAHLEQRIDSIAILKAMGARSRDVLAIYLIETVALGAAGGLLGVSLGMGVEWLLPLLIGRYLPVSAPFSFPWRSALAGVGTGVLTTLLFCLPPLLRVRKVRPLLILRRSVEPAGKQGGLGRLARAAGAGPELAAVAAILAGLALIAALLADSARVGVCFAAGLALTLLALLLLAQAALAGMRRMIRSGRPRLPSVLRHGIANLYRPGNQSAAVLAGLGTGVMLLLTVFLAQRAVLRAIERDQGPTLPNVFLVDISPAELDGLKAAVAAAPGVEAPLEVLPVLSGRILAVDGVEAGQLRLDNYPRRLLQSAVFTWSAALPAGNTLEQGRWFAPGERAVEVSRRVFERLHLHLGSRLRLESGGREIEVEVAGVFRTSGQHVYSRSEFVLPPQLLEGLPVIYYGALRIEPAEVPGLERTLFARYPTVTVINLADVLAAIEAAVRQITRVVRFLAMFSMLAGVVILAMSIAGTRYRRMREAVVLKTLGAGRRYIVTVFSVEFLVLGLLAAAVGVIFAGLLTLALLHVLDVPGRPDVLSALVAIGTTALLAAATGWAASYGTLARKPLEILREQ